MMTVMMIVGVASGIIAGVGSYTFFYAEGVSYFSNDPLSCVNCHIMKEHFYAWSKSSHHAVASCNDCHSPQGLVAKYWTKAINGFNHSLAFTTGNFHEPIQITPRNTEITESACRECHKDITQEIDLHIKNSEPISCVRCHDSVGHLLR